MIHPTCQIPNLDDIYAKYFPVAGTFCEVGAHDGVTYSNTWGLANSGWTGIYIEPIEEYANKCRLEHKDNKVKVIDCACSNYDGEITLFKGQDIYSANSEMVKGQPVFVPCKTLDTILQKHLKAQLDLLVIDVEFHEKEVLEGFTVDAWQPKMVIIEAHESHENEAYRLNADYINEYFKWYKKIYSDGINNIYVR